MNLRSPLVYARLRVMYIYRRNCYTPAVNWTSWRHVVHFCRAMLRRARYC